VSLKYLKKLFVRVIHSCIGDQKSLCQYCCVFALSLVNRCGFLLVAIVVYINLPLHDVCYCPFGAIFTRHLQLSAELAMAQTSDELLAVFQSALFGLEFRNCLLLLHFWT